MQQQDDTALTASHRPGVGATSPGGATPSTAAAAATPPAAPQRHSIVGGARRRPCWLRLLTAYWALAAFLSAFLVCAFLVYDRKAWHRYVKDHLVAAAFWQPTTLPCMSPTLRANDFHVVIAAYAERSCYHWLVADMGLSNAQVIVYRRVAERSPLSSWSLPCGVTVVEKLLLPNHGRESAAFYTYVLEYYDRLPRLGVIFLHGHGESWHQTCEATVSRARLWYTDAEAGGPMAGRIIALNVRQGMANENPNTWFGGDEASGRRRHLGAQQQQQLQQQQPQQPGSQQGRRLILKKYKKDPVLEKQRFDEYAAVVQGVLDKWHVPFNVSLLPGGGRPAHHWSTCCATFILPPARLRLQPLGLYDDLRRLVMQRLEDDALGGRLAHEFLIYPLLNATLQEATDDAAQAFYRNASELSRSLRGHRALRRCNQREDSMMCGEL